MASCKQIPDKHYDEKMNIWGDVEFSRQGSFPAYDSLIERAQLFLSYIPVQLNASLREEIISLKNRLEKVEKELYELRQKKGNETGLRPDWSRLEKLFGKIETKPKKDPFKDYSVDLSLTDKEIDELL